MILVYLTSKNYPGGTADHHFVRQMAKSFTEILGNNFLLVVAGEKGESLAGINKMNLGVRRWRALFFWFWLPRFIKNNRAGELMFFSNDVYLLLILIWWRRIWFGKRYKIVSDWHQLFTDWRDRAVARSSDYLITTSERLKRLLVEKTGVEAGRIEVARGGVELDKFGEEWKKLELRRKLGLPAGKKLVGYAGYFKTMGMEKGVETVIKSLRYLEEEVAAVMVGGREKEIEEYQKLARQEGVEERCLFRPRQTEAAISEYERAMDVLVIPYPNRTHFRDWGFPMKTYEYMASGVPIVYSDLDIIGEVIRDCAMPFQPEEPRDLARAVRLVLEGGEEMRKKTAAAKRKAREFTWKRRAQAILNFISR